MFLSIEDNSHVFPSPRDFSTEHALPPNPVEVHTISSNDVASTLFEIDHS